MEVPNWLADLGIALLTIWHGHAELDRRDSEKRCMKTIDDHKTATKDQLDALWSKKADDEMVRMVYSELKYLREGVDEIRSKSDQRRKGD